MAALALLDTLASLAIRRIRNRALPMRARAVPSVRLRPAETSMPRSRALPATVRRRPVRSYNPCCT
eukprot:7823142-Alexandrium_andersonii.AAC.1